MQGYDIREEEHFLKCRDFRVGICYFLTAKVDHNLQIAFAIRDSSTYELGYG